ncbi:ATP-binding protein [Ferdinandcohnia quinoae]|uniref:histidine kinase n=1 Tax=Fredinandcohnia quinoae TaxID=2918902 RepID=A0AAW5DZ31_9BACI|nr:ATP-binding protein [Fredinandcohnia sp. SECRCQ15]MCH1624275.1 ATP-binding protein [Fredinandcohnia sp. SECRCQ15]
MIIEKLLLHVLITLMPIFVYRLLFEDKASNNFPLIAGISGGITAFLCMIFPYYSLGLTWDLRYVPLLLAIFYGGPLAGGFVLVIILITRTIIGGEFLYLPYIITSLSAVLPMLFYKQFWKYKPKNRIIVAVLIGLWPPFVIFSVMSFHIFSYKHMYDLTEVLFVISIICIVNVFGIFLSTILIEGMIERLMMKKEIQRAEKLNTLGELAASIAHEVRNPLTVVKGFLQLMQKEEMKKQESYFPLVLSELGRAESIINDYLNFAKPQFEKVEELKLREVIYNVIQLLDPLAAKEGVRLTHHLNDESVVKTDRNQLKQALVNIIKNGIEATSTGGSVTIELSSDDDSAYIAITDTGKGMDADQLDRIGTLFYTTKDKGTGVGTTVSTRIIHAMNGTISYKSELEIGTTVSIDIPVLKIQNRASSK